MIKRVLAPALVPAMGRWEEKPDATLLGELQDELRKVANVDARRPISLQEWAAAMENTNVVAGPPTVNDAFLEIADELEMIQTFGIGYDHIDIPACTRKRVIVCNVAEVYSEPVAQHVWALILDLTKHVSRSDRAVRAGTWVSQDWMGLQLRGKTLGIVGLGAIGGRVALKGRLAFDMRVLAYDPYVLPARAQLFGAELVTMKHLFKESDIIVISVPLTPQTHHLVDKDLLSSMKRSAFIVNVCRGAVIDQAVLIEFLQNNLIGGAGLDVFEVEPLPRDSPLLRMENVVLTPHIASSTVEAVEETYRDAVANIVKYLKGLRPYWTINPEAYRG